MAAIVRSTNIKSALRARQRGFLLNPYRFGATVVNDPNFSNVKLLLHGDGPGSTTFTDNSPLALTATALGSGMVTSATKSQWGGRSLRFPNGGGLTYGTTSTFAFLHQPNAKWTWEGWVALDSFANDRTLFTTSNGSTGNIGVYVGINALRGLDFQIYRAGGTALLSVIVASAVGNGTFPNDANFHFVSIDWDHSLGSANLSWAVDNVSGGTANKTANAPSFSSTSTAALKLGGFSSTFDMIGYMDDVRITNSVWRTTTPPIAAFPDS